MPLTTSAGFRVSSVLMKEGANVLDVGVPSLEYPLACREGPEVGGAAVASEV